MYTICWRISSFIIYSSFPEQLLCARYKVTYSLWYHNVQEDMDVGTGAMLLGSELKWRGGRAHCPHPTARRTEWLKPCWLCLEVWGCHFSTHLWIWHCAFWALCLRVSCFNVVYFLVAQENQKSFRQSQEWIYRWVQGTFTLVIVA